MYNFTQFYARCITIDGMALNTTTANGTQTTTQSPQSLVSGTTTAKTGTIQPGTAKDLLNSTNGVALGDQQLTTVSLANSTSTSTSTNTATNNAKNNHNVSPVALGFCALLFVIALVMFFMTNRSAKNTT